MVTVSSVSHAASNVDIDKKRLDICLVTPSLSGLQKPCLSRRFERTQPRPSHGLHLNGERDWHVLSPSR